MDICPNPNDPVTPATEPYAIEEAQIALERLPTDEALYLALAGNGNVARRVENLLGVELTSQLATYSKPKQ